MRFLHLADLHIGKNVNGYNLIEDQRFALNNILKLIEEENLEYVLIAGDIYQSVIPSAEAMILFDDFLSRCTELGSKIIIISGNHDSSDRLAFASSLLKKSNIYISKTYDGTIEKIRFNDEYGPINFYLFPYVKPFNVKKFFPDEDINSYSDAIRTVIDNINIDEDERNIIISHQFILNAQRSESEEIFAGEAEAVADIYYDKFDYVALGHIHKKQSFLGGKIRYPGALLKFSKSEANYKKSVLIVDIKEKGNIHYYEREIEYLRDMRIIKGYFNEIVESSKAYENTDDYIHFEILDEDDIYGGYSILKDIYPNTMTFNYINQKIGKSELEEYNSVSKNIKPIDIFESFYYERRSKELSDEKRKIMEKAIEKVWGRHEDN